MHIAQEKEDSRFSELLHQLLETEVALRPQFLDATCGDDSALRRRLKEVLEEEPTESFLDHPATMAAAASAAAYSETRVESPGLIEQEAQASAVRSTPEFVGIYRVLEVLGEGGMGIVYLVEQKEPVERRLALKLIRSAFPDPRTKILFEAERQAMARLSHPNIAQIFEAGATPEGYPYFVMEHVEGEELIAFCDRRRATIEERLRLFQEICRGVQHAHQRGVIHRDLKPSNILVTETDGQAMVKIIDFGIAAALEGPFAGIEIFPSGVAVGTPVYMSPESLIGLDECQTPDIRTDVYALGVLLYRLLTGHLPLEVAGLDFLGLVKRIITETAPRASCRVAELEPQTLKRLARKRSLHSVAFRRRLARDLDWILVKAMDPEREKRYGSVSEFAADIERHLASEPVTAVPSTTAYRLRKFVRKYRMGVISATVAAVALIAGVVGIGVGLVQARAAESEARAQAERALEAERRAALEAQSASRTSEFLVQIFEVSDPTGVRGGEVTARELLEEGAERIGKELRDEPRVRSTLSLTLGRVYRNLGLADRAQPLVEEALALRRAARSAEPSGASEALADVLIEQGQLRISQGSHEAAESSLQEALALLEATTISVVEGQAGSNELLKIQALESLARIDIDRGRFADAESTFRRLLPRVQRAYGKKSNETAGILQSVARTLAYRGRFQEAEGCYRASLEIRQQIFPADHSVFGGLYTSLGLIAGFRGKDQESIELLRRGVAIYRGSLGDSHQKTLTALNNLGFRLFKTGRYQESAEVLTEAVALTDKSSRRQTLYASSPLTNLGLALWKLGRLQEAEPLFHRASEIRRQTLEPDHPHHATSFLGLANVYRDQGRLEEAEVLYRRALAIRQTALEPDHPEIGSAKQELAELLRRAGRNAEAEVLVRPPG